jgi:putative transposase
VKEQPLKPIDQSNIVGIDVGLKHFATFSDGEVIENPRTLKRYLKKIKKESKSLSRKDNKETGEKTGYGKAIRKSSNNRNKQIYKVQRLHRKVRNIRKDFLHNLTHNIITKYDGVILENLDIKGMLKMNGVAMNRSVSDVSWYEFGRMLEYKSAWNSKHFAKIDRYFASTQLCNSCGHQMTLSLKDRVYSCQNCKAVSDRDVNAARNIRDEGLRLLNNTVATTEIYACGSTALAVEAKQEKRRFRVPEMALA